MTNHSWWRSPASSSLLLFWFFLQQQPERVTSFDCGCPETCTPEAQGEANGAFWSCGVRIAWIKQHRAPVSEANACAAASRTPDMAEEDFQTHPCLFELCHPDGCGSTLQVDVHEHDEPLSCGCPETCTPEILGAAAEGFPYTCQARITHWLHQGAKNHVSEYQACLHSSEEGACNYDACHPVACNSTLEPGPTASASSDDEDDKPKPKQQQNQEIDLCGCPNTCTPTLLGETRQDMDDSCYHRIQFLKTNAGMNNPDACTVSAEEGYCDSDACHPERCHAGGMDAKTVAFLLAGVAAVAVAVYFYLLSPKARRKGRDIHSFGGDGIYRDNDHAGLELTANMPYRDSLGGKNKTSLHSVDLSGGGRSYELDHSDSNYDDDDDDNLSQASRGSSIGPPKSVPPEEMWEVRLPVPGETMVTTTSSSNDAEEIQMGGGGIVLLD